MELSFVLFSFQLYSFVIMLLMFCLSFFVFFFFVQIAALPVWWDGLSVCGGAGCAVAAVHPGACGGSRVAAGGPRAGGGIPFPSCPAFGSYLFCFLIHQVFKKLCLN